MDTTIYNLGCSFKTHVSPIDIINKQLNPGGKKVTNLASPWLSLDGVLRRLYTTNFETDSLLFIGLPLSNRFQGINLVEQLIFHSWFTILLIQKRLQELNLNHYLYNSVYGHMQHNADMLQLKKLKSEISLHNYFQPNHGIKDLVDTDYVLWCKKFIKFIKEK